MKITWLGHSSFLLEESTGTKIVTDPYHSYVGYDMPKVDADIVTVSHAHNDHSYVSAVGGDPTVINRGISNTLTGINDSTRIALHSSPTSPMWHTSTPSMRYLKMIF